MKVIFFIILLNFFYIVLSAPQSDESENNDLETTTTAAEQQTTRLLVTKMVRKMFENICALCNSIKNMPMIKDALLSAENLTIEFLMNIAQYLPDPLSFITSETAMQLLKMVSL